ncbi:protein phosphatase 2C domain-containing protein [Streptomyces sp. A7024]|uniref:Protein phosphatase 2C domain-containing protein n=1 Tax=Streptomyces coryli TaxID=1128680 RepID=A0A6G4U9L8_9ACTN|nr:protein phosphatase 2C domain-containing protein [Streptomyces coryli]NGN68007.1 protein phosphatase 2C domain-containing protein [Streptomyces coryli]
MTSPARAASLGFVVSGAAVAGARHRAGGAGGQDAFRAVPTADGSAVVLAVADGAGRRPRSALGAQLAVDTACALLAEDVPGSSGDEAGPEAWTGWISGRAQAVALRCRTVAEALMAAEGSGAPDPMRASGGPGEALRRVASGPTELRPDPADLAAALVAAVFRPPWAAFVSLGDCTATVLTRDPGEAERCRTVLPPPDGRGAPAFAYTPEAELRARSFALWDPALSGVVLASDGCTPMVFEHPSAAGLPATAGPQPAPRFFCSLAQVLRERAGHAEPLRALLSGAEAERGGDDMAVLCALLGGG